MCSNKLVELAKGMSRQNVESVVLLAVYGKVLQEEVSLQCARRN